MIRLLQLISVTTYGNLFKKDLHNKVPHYNKKPKKERDK